MKVNDFVKVRITVSENQNIARITSIVGSEATIVYDNGQKKTYYMTHLYSDRATMLKTIEFKRERAAKIIEQANKIGSKKPTKKRR